MDDRPLAVRPPTRKRKVKKSEAIWRKSELSTCARVSQSVVEMSRSVVRMSRSVVRMSRSVVKMSPLAPILEWRAFDINHDVSANCDRRISNTRSKKRLLGPPKPEKHPKKRFWSVRNCDLRRLTSPTFRAIAANDEFDAVELVEDVAQRYQILRAIRISSIDDLEL